MGFSGCSCQTDFFIPNSTPTLTYPSQNHQFLKTPLVWLTRTVPRALCSMCTVLNASLHTSFSYDLMYPRFNGFHQAPIEAAGCSSPVFLQLPEEPSPALAAWFC